LLFCNDPLPQQTAARGKEHGGPLRGSPEPGPLGPDFSLVAMMCIDFPGGRMGLDFLVTTAAQITVVVQYFILGNSLFLCNVKNLFFRHAILADYLSLV
jgi:hypothetical protein